MSFWSWSNQTLFLTSIRLSVMLHNIPIGINEKKLYSHNLLLFYQGNYSAYGFEILLSRSLGPFILSVYLPSAMFVMMSWVSFFVPPVSFASIWIRFWPSFNIRTLFRQELSYSWHFVSSSSICSIQRRESLNSCLVFPFLIFKVITWDRKLVDAIIFNLSSPRRETKMNDFLTALWGSNSSPASSSRGCLVDRRHSFV